MKQRLLFTFGLIALGMVAFVAGPAAAQTTSAGPYYATPSWDQQLPASTRFIVLSNWNSAAVLDRETGLVWEKSPSATPSTWLDAQSHCNTLNLGNRKGWRLPTLQELESLVDGDPANTSSPRLPPGHPFTFTPLTNDYWSATTSLIAFPNAAWVVNFSDGVANNHFAKIDLFSVWCVRGGQGVDPQ